MTFKVPRAISVSLTDDDLYFISESVNQNVPSEEDMSPEERRTYRKIKRAHDRLRDKVYAAMKRNPK